VIPSAEREKMLKARSIGPTMLRYLEEIGVASLAELRGADPQELALRIDVALGRRHMNAQGVRALANLVALAEAEAG